MGRFREYLKKNTFKDIFGGLYDEYDLKKCVLTRKAINKHTSKIYLLALIPTVILLSIGAIYPYWVEFWASHGIGEVLEYDDTGLILLSLSLWSLLCGFGYILAMDGFLVMLNKRINAIAGVNDGEEKTTED